VPNHDLKRFYLPKFSFLFLFTQLLIMKSFTLLFFLGVTTALFAQPNNFPNVELDNLIEAKIEGLAPGVAVGIVKDGEIIYEKYIGYANLSDDIKNTAESRFNIASNAKQFTAICVLNLALEGKLSLKDDFRKYLPQFYPDIQTPILIEQLITHSSGIRDFYDLLSLEGTPWWKRVGLDNKDALKLLAAQKELNFLPGSDYAYSNSNYTLLTELVKKVSGLSFDAYSQIIFKQFGMNSTQFSTNYMEVIPHKTLPYSNWGDGRWQQYPMVVDLNGDGFLFTTLPDQLKWEQVLQTKNVLENQKQLLLSSQEKIKGVFNENYGFGIEINDYKGYPVVQHAGSTGAYGTHFLRFPSQNISIVVMGNNGNIGYTQLANKVADIVLSIKESTVEKDNYLPEDFGQQKSLGDLIGLYRSQEGEIIKIYEEEQQLIWKIHNQNQLTLLHEKGNLYSAKENKAMKVLFSGAKNKRQFTVFYPGTTPRKHKVVIEEELNPAYYSTIDGTYRNEETNTEFTLAYEKENRYKMHVFGKDRIATLLLKDELRMNGIKLRIERNLIGAISEIFVDYGRNKNIRYRRISEINLITALPTKEGGQIMVNTTATTYGKGKGDILLTKTDIKGNEEWFKIFGGKSYDKASSILNLKDGGYLIIGSTSSFGNGNYDIWLIKTDEEGKEIWNKTYGGFYNEYGYIVEEKAERYIIKGKKQVCPDNTNWEKCSNYFWVIETDKEGNEFSNTVDDLPIN